MALPVLAPTFVHIKENPSVSLKQPHETISFKDLPPSGRIGMAAVNNPGVSAAVSPAVAAGVGAAPVEGPRVVRRIAGVARMIP